MRFAALTTAAALALAAAACGDNSKSDDMSTQANLTDDSAMDEMLGANETAATNAPSAMPTDAAGFANAVAANDLYEIEASKIVREKGSSADLKSLAQMLQREHGTSSAQLNSAAAKANVTVTPALDREKQALLDELKAQSGTALDALYIDQQRMAHQKALLLLQNYRASGDKEPMKLFAANAQTMVEDHLDRLNAVRK